MEYRFKRPMGRLMMGKMRDGRLLDYKADTFGNVNVTDPQHIDSMVGLGYPIYNGDGKTKPVTKEMLIWPSLDLQSEYWRRINQAKNIESIKI
jgi:hypothetical protein